MSAIDRDGRRRHFAWAALVFAAAAPITYALVRCVEHLRASPADSVLAFHQSSMGFLWRWLLATWWAGVCAVLSYAVMRRSGGSAAGRTRIGVVAAASALVAALLAWLFP